MKAVTCVLIRWSPISRGADAPYPAIAGISPSVRRRDPMGAGRTARSSLDLAVAVLLYCPARPPSSSPARNPCEWVPGLGWRSHREATPGERPRRGACELDNGTWKAPEVAEEVDRRVVARPAQVRQLLAAVAAIRPDLTTFFGCLYFATMRP